MYFNCWTPSPGVRQLPWLTWYTKCGRFNSSIWRHFQVTRSHTPAWQTNNSHVYILSCVLCVRSAVHLLLYFPGWRAGGETLTGTRGIKSLWVGTTADPERMTGTSLGGGILTNGILMTGCGILSKGVENGGRLIVLWTWCPCGSNGGSTRLPCDAVWRNCWTCSPPQILFRGGRTSVQLLTWLYAPHVHTFTPSGWDTRSPSFTMWPPMLQVPEKQKLWCVVDWEINISFHFIFIEKNSRKLYFDCFLLKKMFIEMQYLKVNYYRVENIIGYDFTQPWNCMIYCVNLRNLMPCE